MTLASVIVPAFNVSATLRATLEALVVQTHQDFEIIVVDDGSTDTTAALAHGFEARANLTVLSQANRGLAGARNTGIAHARGRYIGFCDADDIWRPEKLQRHIAHLEGNPDLGVSYSGSALIAEDGAALGLAQRPKLSGISAEDILKRNPIGNGSAAVFRREALLDLAYRPGFERQRDWVFDETFRQSEDIECWLRLALSTDWQFEGLPQLLTEYRVNASGLSAALDKQLASWERAVAKLRPLAPDFFARHEAAARAYQLRYLARRAISSGRSAEARALLRRAMGQSLTPFAEEPIKSLATWLAAALPETLSAFALAHLHPQRRAKPV